MVKAELNYKKSETATYVRIKSPNVSSIDMANVGSGEQKTQTTKTYEAWRDEKGVKALVSEIHEFCERVCVCVK